jgi:hypothetical protein
LKRRESTQAKHHQEKMELARFECTQTKVS